MSYIRQNWLYRISAKKAITTFFEREMSVGAKEPEQSTCPKYYSTSWNEKVHVGSVSYRNPLLLSKWCLYSLLSISTFTDSDYPVTMETGQVTTSIASCKLWKAYAINLGQSKKMDHSTQYAALPTCRFWMFKKRRRCLQPFSACLRLI